MKKSVLTFFSALMLLVTAQAQTETTAKTISPPQQTTTTPAAQVVQSVEQRAQDKTNSLEKELGLSKEQKAQVYTLALDFYKKLDGLQALKESNKDEYKSKKQENKKSFRKALLQKLTPAQKQKFDELKQSK